MNNKLKEKYLFFKAKRQNPEAFIKIYKLFVDRIYRFIFLKTSNKEISQDLTSDVFLKAWQYIQSNKVKQVRSLSSFLYAIARNRVIDYYRQKNRRAKEVELDNSEKIADTKQAISEKIDISFEIKKINKALEQIKEEYKEVIILKYIEELSTKEIAQILNKDKGNVRVLVHRALNVLREVLDNDDNNKNYD